MEWKSSDVDLWVRYIHIELIDYGTSCVETDSIFNNKFIDKIKMANDFIAGKNNDKFTYLIII